MNNAFSIFFTPYYFKRFSWMSFPGTLLHMPMIEVVTRMVKQSQFTVSPQMINVMVYRILINMSVVILHGYFA